MPRPEIRTMPTAPRPGAVAMATIGGMPAAAPEASALRVGSGKFGAVALTRGIVRWRRATIGGALAGPWRVND